MVPCCRCFVCCLLWCRLGDEGEAVAFHSEAFAADRTNLDTVSWLGAHYVRRQDYLAAVPYFEAAGRVQPREVRSSVVWWGAVCCRC